MVAADKLEEITYDEVSFLRVCCTTTVREMKPELILRNTKISSGNIVLTFHLEIEKKKHGSSRHEIYYLHPSAIFLTI